jgi:K+ transporter
VADRARTPLIRLDFADSAETLGAVAYAMAGGEALRRYMGHLEKSGEVRTASFACTTATLRSFAKEEEKR